MTGIVVFFLELIGIPYLFLALIKLDEKFNFVDKIEKWFKSL